MFNYLSDMSISLDKRYQTIEKNIKAKSNSFYDSTLSFLEEFVRFVSYEEELEVEESLSFVLYISQSSFKNFILSECNFEKEDYEKVYSMSKSINTHKHNKEKELNDEDVINYLRICNGFMSAYHSHKFTNGDYTFNSKYFYEIFGSTELVISDLLKQREKLERSLKDENEQKALLQDDLIKLNNLTNIEKLKRVDIEKQKDILQDEVSQLKDIKLTTMEEKVARIVDILDRQTSLLEKMEQHLKIGAQTRFGAKPTR